MKRTLINQAVAATIGVSAALMTPAANAATSTFNWTGFFTLLDPSGFGVSNTSITARNANQVQTPISGTMEFDQSTGAGVGTVDPFGFLSAGNAVAHDVAFQAVGDGMGGQGTLVVGNMLFDWNGNNSIPVSLVMDAAGFFTATPNDFADGVLDNTDAAVISNGATPASDGTLDSNVPGSYLGLGPAVMATTDWNTANLPGCVTGVDVDFSNNVGGGCMGVALNGGLVIPGTLADDAVNKAQAPFDASYLGTGTGIGGSPMQDGPFQGFNANFDVMTLSPTGTTTNTINPFGVIIPGVPVPAAVWLFGSGLLGLVGVARRRKVL